MTHLGSYFYVFLLNLAWVFVFGELFERVETGDVLAELHINHLHDPFHVVDLLAFVAPLLGLNHLLDFLECLGRVLLLLDKVVELLLLRLYCLLGHIFQLLHFEVVF